MARSTWVLGLVRALSAKKMARFALGLGLCSVVACLNVNAGEISPPTTEVAGSGSFSNPGLVSDPPGPGCVPANHANPVFASQAFNEETLFAREFYSWTSDEQALALRTDKELFSLAAPSSSEPFTLLRNVGASIGGAAQLAQALGSAFGMGRLAWPEPWPTRMGWPGQASGGQLVRITLKPEAWLAIAAVGTVYVYDAERHVVATADALAHPERIGVIYFDSSRASPDGCSDGIGYRGFLLGNLAMVQEWSLGTQQIAARIQDNIAQLTQFLNDIRSCPVTSDAASWAQAVLCSWSEQPGEDGAIATDASSASGGDGFNGAGTGGMAAGLGGMPAGTGGMPAGMGDSGEGGVSSAGGSSASGADGFGTGGIAGSIPTEIGAAGSGVDGRSLVNPGTSGKDVFAYEQALATPSANYLAAPAQIAAIIEMLQGDLFEPDPLVVSPGSP
jgi:hypothetical protein